MRRAVALVDGEHYPSVVRDALTALPYDFVGAILVGGTEKLREAQPDYGVPLLAGFEGAEVVVDLSDEPVLGPSARFAWVARALAAGLPYVGADFRFDPPAFEAFDLPSVAVFGTGKRVGKTAVTGALARLLARGHEVVVVAMGRGGPAEPELVREPPGVDELVRRSRAGLHAASDHLETAALCGVPTIGCRRAGGGLAGAVFTSNVAEGAALARTLAPDVVVFDGSGASIPPVAVDRRILVVGRADDETAYLNPYRLLLADAVVRIGVDAELELRPLEPLEGRIAVFTAGATDVSHLEGDIVHVSGSLANRDLLRRELDAVDADTYLVELKAAAIDVVAEHALARGRRVVLGRNDLVGDGIDELLLGAAPAVRA